MIYVALGALCVIPVAYFVINGCGKIVIRLDGFLFAGLIVMLLVEGVRNGNVARDKVIAMLLIFAFNILFWMFFEQAGSSFYFLGGSNRQS